jgi:hypothetical protein
LRYRAHQEVEKMNVNRIEEKGESTMKRYTRALLVIIVALLACAHTTAVDPANIDQCRDLREKTAHREATVALRSGMELEARCLFLRPDSTSWLDPHTHELKTVATADVVEVQMVHRGKGTLEGLGIGLLTGTLTGAVIGFADGDDPPGWFSMTAGQKAAMGGVAFGSLGGLAGTVAGAMNGHREEFYVLQASRRDAGER